MLMVNVRPPARAINRGYRRHGSVNFPFGVRPRARATVEAARGAASAAGKWPVSGRFRALSGVFGAFRGAKGPFPAGSGQSFIRFRERIRTFRATVGVFLPYP